MAKKDHPASKRGAAVMAALKDLESKLSNAFEEAKADPTNGMRDFCVVALPAVANFLEKSDVKNEIVRKFFELATFIDEGRLPFLRPPKASGRTYDSLTLWIPRAYVVVGLECILRSRKEAGSRQIYCKKVSCF